RQWNVRYKTHAKAIYIFHTFIYWYIFSTPAIASPRVGAGLSGRAPSPGLAATGGPSVMQNANRRTRRRTLAPVYHPAIPRGRRGHSASGEPTRASKLGASVAHAALHCFQQHSAILGVIDMQYLIRRTQPIGCRPALMPVRIQQRQPTGAFDGV